MPRRPCLFSRSGTLFLLLAAAAVAAPSAHAQWRALQALEQRGALVSASAVDLDDNNKVIQQVNATTRLTPASLTKLTTAALALQTWPAGKTFQTRILANAPVVRGRLAGDLILEGAGDPSLDDESLWQLAAQVRGAGVDAVSGDLFVDPAPFGVVTCEALDR
ncbi:MAG TPA: D-alanyl-D-alanine carboxypeptidase, partial [Steroidobacteraceae bacterium]|nr:D-alanyl-D-alanine carboxypeptidase [Steroidobacteraceae bacterium]